jgi:hypothetical protein
MPIGVGAAILGGAGIQGASSLAGGKKGASAATQAAQIQAQTARQALGLQQSVYQQIQANLQPFMDYGTGGIGPYDRYLGQATSPIDTSFPQFTFQPTQAQLEQTPGYQFTRAQALDAEQANLLAAGRGTGSAAAGGAASRAASLASTDWQSVFNAQQAGYQTNVNSLLAGRTMDLQQRQQIMNMLAGRVGIGQSAAAATAGVGENAASTLGSTITGIGAAQASGVVGSANALTGGLTGAGSSIGGALQSFGTLQALGLGSNTNFNPVSPAGVSDVSAFNSTANLGQFFQQA